mgnify:CR=1 FL=1
MERFARLLVFPILLVLLTPLASAQSLPFEFKYIEVPSRPVPKGVVDIIVEANTYTPYFYVGRAEPSAGNSVRLVALPVVNENSDQKFDFDWQIDGKRVSGSTGREAGYSSIVVTAPYAKNMLVSVRVDDENGSLFAEKSEYVPLPSPQIVFYEENPLRGVAQVAINKNYILVGDEVTLRAEPYFIGKNDAPPSLQATWSINGEAVKNGRDWQSLALKRPEEITGSYSVSLTLGHATKLLQSAQAKFNLDFGL